MPTAFLDDEEETIRKRKKKERKKGKNEWKKEWKKERKKKKEKKKSIEHTYTSIYIYIRDERPAETLRVAPPEQCPEKSEERGSSGRREDIDVGRQKIFDPPHANTHTRSSEMEIHDGPAAAILLSM
jgi:hypothetical protein